MRICEGQKLGALTILIVSLAVYGRALLYDQQSLPELSLPWGNQEPGMIAAEVTGSRDADGIYFLPEGMDIANIVKTINVDGRIDTAGFAISDGAAIDISLAEGVLAISDMPSIRRLALGLPIDLNRASEEDLSRVPGIGERMATEIVQRRQTVGKFMAFSDLTTVPGIKEKKLIGLKKYLTIGLTP
jgi:competence protein ComEA